MCEAGRKSFARGFDEVARAGAEYLTWCAANKAVEI